MKQLTVAELIEMLSKIEDKSTAITFHNIGRNHGYAKSIEYIRTDSKYTKQTTITIK